MKHFYSLVLLLFVFATVGAQTINLNEAGFIQTQELQVQERLGGSDFKDVKRVRPFYLNSQIKNHQNIQRGQQITLTLFDDVIYTATVLVKTTDINAVTTMTLRLNSFKYAYAYIAVSADSYLVTVDLPEQNQKYSSRSSINTEQSYMVQLNEAEFQNAVCGVDDVNSETGNGNGAIPQMSEGMNRLPNSSTENINIDGSCIAIPDISESATIRIMIVYTTEAQNWSDTNNGGIANSIAITMALANQVSVNNNLGITFQLAYSGLVNYTQVSIGTDWVNLLTDGDGILDEVNTLRQDYDADLVSILNYYTSGGTAGIANLLTSKYGNNRAVFSSVRVNFAVNSNTFIHEIGHNLGAMHNPYQNSDPGPTDWENWSENTWSAGWRWQGSDTNYYADLMSYQSGSEYQDGQATFHIPYFSDPSHTHLGGTAGDPILGDNARTLKEIKHFVARYKETIDYCNAGNAPLYAITNLYIDNVTMGVINNASGASSVRYGDFTALATCMIPGDTQTLDISVVNSNSGRPVKVWIDWNSDNIFDPDTELIYDSITGSANHSVNVTAPLGVSYGTKRLRIRTYSLTTDPVVDGPCGYSGLGEVEDYTIILEEAEPCTSAEVPQTFQLDEITTTTAQLSWNSQIGIDHYELRYRSVGAPNWETVSPIWYPNYTLTDLTFETAYEAQVRAVCSGSPSAYSSNLEFTTTSYCTTLYGEFINAFITRIRLGDIDNASSISGYSDFTSISTDVFQGTAYEITINNAAHDYNRAYAVWIDYNKNGVFDEPEERVWSQTITNAPEVSGQFTIPETSVIDQVVMRVAVIYTNNPSYIPSPCFVDTGASGEAEDYTLNIMPLVTCDEPTIPINLVVSNITNDEATLTWDTVLGTSYDVRYREIGASEWIDITNVAQNTVTFVSLLAETDYEAQVRSICNGSAGSYSSSTNFSTIGYCTSGGDSNINILNVTFGTINQSSGTTVSSYTDFTDVSTVLENGQAYAISINAPGPPISKTFRVWIDYNLNSGFEDSGELVLDVPNTMLETVQGNITIPDGTPMGTARMRVSVKMYSGVQGPCDTFDFGEVEDYSVKIHDGTLGIETPAFGDGFTLYPNPMTDVFYIATQNIQDNEVDITVRTIIGQRVFSKSMRVPFDGILAVELPGLATGQYVVELIHPEGGKFISKLLKK